MHILWANKLVHVHPQLFFLIYNIKLLADDVRRTNTSVTDMQRSTGGGARLEMVPAPTWKFKFFIF